MTSMTITKDNQNLFIIDANRFLKNFDINEHTLSPKAKYSDLLDFNWFTIKVACSF